MSFLEALVAYFIGTKVAEKEEKRNARRSQKRGSFWEEIYDYDRTKEILTEFKNNPANCLNKISDSMERVFGKRWKEIPLFGSVLNGHTLRPDPNNPMNWVKDTWVDDGYLSCFGSSDGFTNVWQCAFEIYLSTFGLVTGGSYFYGPKMLGLPRKHNGVLNNDEDVERQTAVAIAAIIEIEKNVQAVKGDKHYIEENALHPGRSVNWNDPLYYERPFAPILKEKLKQYDIDIWRDEENEQQKESHLGQSNQSSE